MTKTISNSFKTEIIGLSFENLSEDFKKIPASRFYFNDPRDICIFCIHRDLKEGIFYCEYKSNCKKYSTALVNSLEELNEICAEFEFSGKGYRILTEAGECSATFVNQLESLLKVMRPDMESVRHMTGEEIHKELDVWHYLQENEKWEEEGVFSSGRRIYGS